jgi:hypothetical protein
VLVNPIGHRYRQVAATSGIRLVKRAPTPGIASMHRRHGRGIPLGLGFSTSQDLNGDIALIACFASTWTPAMVR